jgi:hypothetical protein
LTSPSRKITLLSVETILEELQERFDDFVFIGRIDSDEPLRTMAFNGDTDVLLGLCDRVKNSILGVESQQKEKISQKLAKDEEV